MTVIPSAHGSIEIASGRGDLRYGSILAPPPTPPAYPSWFGLHGFDRFLVDGPRLTPISFARIHDTQPLVFAAVQRLLTWATKVPLKVYRRDDDDSRTRLRPADHPLAAAVYRPWERAGTLQLVWSLLGPLLVHGSGTVQALSGAGNRIEFQARDWRYLAALQVFQGRISGWESTEDGIDEVIPAQEMVHCAYWSPCGPLGTSPLQALGVTLEIDTAARRFTKNSLRNMARPPSAITVSNDFLGFEEDERRAALDLVREQIETTLTGENAGKPAILPAGLDWKAVGHTAAEAELIDQRKIDRDEINAVYQMPPPSTGDLEHATYSNIEVLREVGYTDSLGPPLVMIEGALNAQLVNGLLAEPDIFVEFDFAGVLRGNKLAEIQALREAIGTALMTPNEGRDILNQPRSDAPGMDDFYLPSNNLTALGAPAPDQAPAPTPAPEPTPTGG